MATEPETEGFGGPFPQNLLTYTHLLIPVFAIPAPFAGIMS